jgi:hypothetical protein
MTVISDRVRSHVADGLTMCALVTATFAVLAGCTSMPSGPTVAVMPAATKPFEIFMQDDALCRSWASHSIGLPGHDAAAERMLGSTIAGIALGAAIGAAAGGHHGAGPGAAFGGAVGASQGSVLAQAESGSAQRRYDIAYLQCMYAQGNAVPVRGGYQAAPAAVVMPPPPPRP